MKRDEAEQIFGMLCAAYNVPTATIPERAPTWIAGLEELDAAAATKVVFGLLKGAGSSYMPTLPDFSAQVRAVSDNLTERPMPAGGVDCRLCLDTALVEVGTSKVGTIELAPCPACERGKRLEFPEARRGIWGTDGFWRGRDWRPAGPNEVEILG